MTNNTTPKNTGDTNSAIPQQKEIEFYNVIHGILIDECGGENLQHQHHGEYFCIYYKKKNIVVQLKSVEDGKLRFKIGYDEMSFSYNGIRDIAPHAQQLRKLIKKYNGLESVKDDSQKEGQQGEPKTGHAYFNLQGKGVRAKGYVHANGKNFVVCKGSQAVIDAQPLMNGGENLNKAKRDRVSLEQGDTLEKRGGVYVFTKDHVFSTPSNAACVILGSPASGANWKDEDGNPLKTK